MAKIVRKNMKIFGSTAGAQQRGVFGSLAAGSPAYSTDPETIQSLANYEAGWYGAVLGNNSPAIQDMNALQFLYAYQLAYLMQAGVAEWNAATTYYIGSYVNSGGELYHSLTDDNLNNAVTDTANWEPLAARSNKQIPYALYNLGFTATANAGAMTVAIKQANASSDPTAASPVSATHRSRTITSAALVALNYTAAQSVVIPSTATLGFKDGQDAKVFLYSIYDGTNLELAVSSALKDEGALHSTTAIDTSADGTALYSTTARTDCSIRLLGWFQVDAITTAGTWTAASSIATQAFQGQKKGLLQTVIFTATGTYNKNPYADYVKATVVGGGGGGGGANAVTAQASGGAGGAAGGIAIKTIPNSSIGDTEAVTVGEGGDGSANANSGGSPGDTSSFGAHCSATGGTGGGVLTAGTIPQSQTGGLAGEGSGGDLNIAGAPGSPCFRLDSSRFVGGGGGSNMFGGGGRGLGGATASNDAGLAGRGYGAGGGGATKGGTTAGAQAGGDGTDGVVIVEEYKL